MKKGEFTKAEFFTIRKNLFDYHNTSCVSAL